jgi:bile acid:Na+ symporter, BASS family
MLGFAPYGPPFSAMAKGNVAVSVELMVILAGSSALIAPLLLRFLIPIVAGDIPLRIDVVKMARTLLGEQLLPLCVGFQNRVKFNEHKKCIQSQGS